MAWTFSATGMRLWHSKKVCVAVVLIGLVAPASVCAKDIGVSIDVPQDSHVKLLNQAI